MCQREMTLQEWVDTLASSHRARRELRDLEQRAEKAATYLAAAREQLAEWEDPDSPKRQALLEETVFNLGEGNRSEIELREGELALVNADRERMVERIKELEAVAKMLRADCDAHRADKCEVMQDLAAARERTVAIREAYANFRERDDIEPLAQLLEAADE